MAKKKKSGVEPFADDVLNDEEMEDDEMASKSESRRRRINAEAESEEDEDTEDEDAEDEDEPTDEADDEGDDEDEEEEEVQEVGFAPFIIHENAEWDLEDVIDEADTGETLYFFRPPSEDNPVAKWYKLQPIEVGEVGEVTPAS